VNEDCDLCGSRLCVDADHFCNACARVVPRQLRASPLPVQEPQGPAHYMIPLDAKNSDWVCAETLPQIPSNYCVTVKAFRIFTMDPKVEP
jgi:hypothetical protein